MHLGVVKELWRYPVKSVGGEPLASARVARRGLVGDRTWACLDAASGEIRSAKQLPRLLSLRARTAPGAAPRPDAWGDDVADVELELPDGRRLSARDPAAAPALSAAVGAALRLAPLAPPEDRAHYRLRAPRGAEAMAEQMALQPGEPMPDFSGAPPEMLALLAEHATPPGSYVDSDPLHLLTTASQAELRARSGLEADRLRFRPNLWVDTGNARGFVEEGWAGRRLRVGGAVLAVVARTIRCSMPMRAQPPFALAEEPRLTSALVVHCRRHLGVNLSVESEGEIRVGDAVEAID